MQNNNQLAVIAIVAALGVLGVVVVTVATLTIQLQEAEAQKGVCGTPGLFPSAINSGNRSLISCVPR